jgi:TonB-linked SusC/RagA family outer membrane protein
MKKLLLVSLCFLLLCVTQVFAQNRTVTGTVTAKEDGLPIPGATVKVKGSTVGTQTNSAGKFTLGVPSGGSIVISFVGTQTQTISVGNQSTINVSLVAAATSLGEVVITTSLGIKHSERELGYSTASVSSKDLTETNVTNVANGLTAKVAGLAVYSLDNGIDPTIQVQLRGNRSLEGNNNALIVVDGVPIPGGTLAAINPNDIADVTILKGAGSAALYGSEASNGAILITTKRGTSSGKPIITYGNSVQLENVSFYPKLQTKYGPYGGEPVSTGFLDPLTNYSSYVPYENQQFGPAYDGSLVPLGAPLDSLKGTQVMVPYKAYPVSPIIAFFKTGVTEQNDISIQQGDANNSFFLSAQNVIRTTIVPNDRAIKNAFSARGHRTFGKFSVDYSIGYTKTNFSTYINNDNAYNLNGNNFTIPGSFVTNAGANDLYASILQLPAFINIKSFQDPNSRTGNASNFYDAYAINPYWIVNNARRNVQRDQIISTLKLNLAATSWLDASYRISDNYGVEQDRLTKAEVDFTPYSLSDPLGAGNVPSGFSGTGKAPGSVYDYTQYGDGTKNAPGGYARIQGDALLDFHHTFFKDFKVNLIVGNSIWQEHQKELFSGNNNLLINGFYNINSAGGTITSSESEYTIRQISYFGDFQISYKNFLSLEGTYRNEQDSRLSKAERSFNYPSAKISFIPTDIIPGLKDSKILNYAKLYGSISRVGNIDINPYQINNIFQVGPGFPYGTLGGYQLNTEQYSPTLKPELTTEVEFGAELQFFNSRLGINATYYDQHDKNQTVPINISTATGYQTSLTNIGETQSQGEEFQVTADILTQAENKFGFRLGGNLSINNSKVISLLPGVNSLALGLGQFAVVGKPFPLLEGTDFVRDPKGNVVVDAVTGYPTTDNTQLKQFGRTTPKYNLGVTTTFSYKFISLTGIAEYRGGDVLFNGQGGTLTFAGSSFESAEAGRQSFIYPGSVIQTSPGVYTKNTNVNVQNGNYGFWQTSAFPGTASPFVTSGAFWKIREINLSFNLNQFMTKTGFIKGATFAVTGRNLWMFLPKSNMFTDPEFSNAGANSNTRGTNDDGQLPGTRVFGADLKITF